MKLYTSPRAPNPRRVRWAMAEKGIEDIEIVDIDILGGEHRGDAYRDRAGLAHVPALTIDDATTITESIAICRYLESVYPDPDLFGLDPRETAVIEMWMRRAEIMLATPLMLGVRHSHPALAAIETQVPAIAERNLATATQSLAVFDARLAEAEFIGGDRVTIADIVAICAIDFARMIRFAVPEDHGHVARWAAAMRARPAAAAGA